MEAFFSNQWSIAIFASVGIVGLGVCWFGALVALVTALGNKKWLWGVAILILGPVAGILYSIIYNEAEYAKSLMIKGGLLLLPGLIFVLFVWLFF